MSINFIVLIIVGIRLIRLKFYVIFLRIRFFIAKDRFVSLKREVLNWVSPVLSLLTIY